MGAAGRFAYDAACLSALCLVRERLVPRSMTQPDPIAKTVDGSPAARRQPRRLTFDSTSSASPISGRPPAPLALQAGDGQRRGGWLSFAASLAVAAAGLASLPRTPPHAAGASPQPAASAMAKPVLVAADPPAELVPSDASTDRCTAPTEPRGNSAPLASQAGAAEPTGVSIVEPGIARQGDAGPGVAVPVPAAAASVDVSATLPADARPQADAAPSLIRAAVVDTASHSPAGAASPGARPAESFAEPVPDRIGRGSIDRDARPLAVAAPRPLKAMHRATPALTPLQRRQCGHLGFIGRGFCEQRVRLAFCSGRYGRSADCPVPQPNLAN